MTISVLHSSPVAAPSNLHLSTTAILSFEWRHYSYMYTTPISSSPSIVSVHHLHSWWHHLPSHCTNPWQHRYNSTSATYTLAKIHVFPLILQNCPIPYHPFFNWYNTSSVGVLAIPFVLLSNHYCHATLPAASATLSMAVRNVYPLWEPTNNNSIYQYHLRYHRQNSRHATERISSPIISPNHPICYHQSQWTLPMPMNNPAALHFTLAKMSSENSYRTSYLLDISKSNEAEYNYYSQ